MEKINLFKKAEKNSYAINLNYDNIIIYIEQETEYLQGEMITQYTGINRLDYLKKTIDKFSFNRSADLFSFINSNKVIYYGNVRKNNDVYFIDVNKVDCENLKEEHCVTINTNVNVGINESFDMLCLNSQLIGINERYSMVFLPSVPIEYPFFKKVLLIDTIEKKTYVVPPLIEDLDSILRIESLKITPSSEKIIFKTGRIGNDEKRQIWKEQNYKDTLINYEDEVESLIVCDVKQFINDVKKQVAINKNKILETCSGNKGLRLIKACDGKIMYSIQQFKENLTYIKIFNCLSNVTQTIEAKGFYDYIDCFNDEFYGFIRKNKLVDVFNIKREEKIASVPGIVVYIDNNEVISQRYKLEEGEYKRVLTTFDLNEKMEINSFQHNNYCLNNKQNKLIIF